MIREWWQQLAERERILVALCGVVIVLAVVWLAIIQPLFKGAADLEENVATKQGRLSNLQELAAQYQGSAASNGGGGGGAGGNDSIVVVIDRTTRERSLAGFLKRNQPEGNAGVRLRFENAPFDDLVDWLGELNQNYGMITVSANFDEAGTGRVNCSIVLSRQGM